MTAQTRLAFVGGEPCRFYIGTHMPHWLGVWPVRLFVSRRRLMRRKSFPRALAPWALDSGGFTEVTKFGGWTVAAADYAAEVARYADEVGSMEWASIQDWMCEPEALAKTGKSVAEHQALTTRSLLDLRALAPDMPWAPVVQGWNLDDYQRHADAYEAAGIRLAEEPIVGVGSVCRRQGSTAIRRVLESMACRSIRCHGFGVKTTGLELSARFLRSADSMAWSVAGKKRPMLGHPHKNCANCLEYARAWRSRVVSIPGVA